MRLSGVSLAVLAGFHVNAVMAQAAEQPSGGIDEIVVTAEKRESSVQKTAIAVTAFDQKALERNGVSTLTDIAAIAPGVGISKNSANVIIAVRGVSSQNTNEIGDPAISIAQDGFYIQKPFGFGDSMFDLERVEVLRGPQGTLYGRNATGGAINVITAKPKDEFEGKVAVGVGNYDQITTEGMINLPVTDRLAVRAAFTTNKHDGYRTNEAPARAGDDADSQSVRLHVQWKPTDRLKFLLTGQLTKIGGVGPTMWGTPLRFNGTAIDTSYRPDVDGEGTPHSLPNQYIDTTLRTIQWNGEYDLGFASLVYLGGFRDTDYSQLRDLDGTTSKSAYLLPTEKVHDWSHEVRLVSNGNGRFKWQIGGYLFREQENLLSLFQSYAVANPPSNIFIFSYDVKARSKAAFGQASYELIDGLKAELGIRYSDDFKSRAGYSNTGSGNVPQNDSSSSNKTTYHAGLIYDYSPRNMVYAKFDTGYKAGGFNTVPGQNTLPYAPETISAWEVGLKNRFLDNRLQLNLSAFLYNYKDQQVSVRDQTVGLSAVFNAGKSRIWGIEAETVFQPTDADRFDGSAVFLHSEYTQLCVSVAANGSCLTDYSGNRATQAPRWSFNLGYEHSFPLFGGTLTPRAQTHIESSSFYGIENFAYQKQDGYTRSDLVVTFTPENKKWSLQGFVRNLENVTVITSAVASTRFGTYSYGMAPPRTYGAKLTYNF
ncbi:TonB-dependent receptor [Sphingobium sp. Sx8-8]|uniref:TonB-dependent receptor n=1 Tax=Sphingobium sp. Sx8-8 TaxID=2933617 RepID=UPI001F59B568|nr:TonB-dependent receptor [Sphingobium sp. Sx8-8]